LWLGVFMHNNDGDREKEWWKCDGVYGFYVFVSFSFIWDEWIGVDITGHWLNVRQGTAKQWGRIFFKDGKERRKR
jgi:hypothetical protein